MSTAAHYDTSFPLDNSLSTSTSQTLASRQVAHTNTRPRTRRDLDTNMPPFKRHRSAAGGRTSDSSFGLSTSHWDDPGAQPDTLPYDEGSADVDVRMNGEEEEDEDEGDESRDLTHEEIWDDSALIEAWNAANEEYEVCSCFHEFRAQLTSISRLCMAK